VPWRDNLKARPHLSSAYLTLAYAGVIIVLASAVLTAFGTGKAVGRHVSCGDVVKTDTKLDSDLVNCPNNGIVIGADGVTLDLNGHLVDGDGTKSDECNPNKAICDTGVANDGQDNFTLMNGRVRGFDVGVLVGTTTPGKVRDSRVVDISSIRNRHIGIAIFSTNGGLVRNSLGTNSLARHAGVGLALGEASHIRVIGSSFQGNSDHGIFAIEARHNLFKGNLISRTATGIFLIDSDHNGVSRNSVTDVGEGILVDNDRQKRTGSPAIVSAILETEVRVGTASRSRKGMKI
jgi:hypothetical protein